MMKPKIVQMAIAAVVLILGLMRGHSANRHDIMFFASTPEPIAKLSQRDLNTIRLIYKRKL